MPYFLSEIDVPVYGTAFTLALVDRRLEEYELEEEPRFIHVKPKQIVEIGPFKIEFIHVTHSIVSAVALAITTPLGVIIHTGDFKVDPTPTDNELFDLHTLADYGKRGVLLLLSDSTNADRAGYTESERAVQARAWRRSSTAPNAASSSPASVPRSTASSWCSISPRNTAAAWRSSAAAWCPSPRSPTRSACSIFRTASCCARRTP